MFAIKASASHRYGETLCCKDDVLIRFRHFKWKFKISSGFTFTNIKTPSQKAVSQAVAQKKKYGFVG